MRKRPIASNGAREQSIIRAHEVMHALSEVRGRAPNAYHRIRFVDAAKLVGEPPRLRRQKPIVRPRASCSTEEREAQHDNCRPDCAHAHVASHVAKREFLLVTEDSKPCFQRCRMEVRNIKVFVGRAFGVAGAARRAYLG